MKLGSLFDGSGGFPLAGTLCGITPVFASEIEPYPVAVTTSRFPNMLHLGDISKINGAEIPPVTIITFGSPCQDLSVAGKRAGLKHSANGDDETTRSGLFMEAVRIIKEMRRATNGKYPRYAVWENVMGAFSSNAGNDFRVVLEELIKIAEPEAPPLPPPGKAGWPYADCIMGDGWSLAWRSFDAQYWGVAQRRRRLYALIDLAGDSAPKVLFERPGLRGYFEKGRSPWQDFADHAQESPGADDTKSGCLGFDCYNQLETGSVSKTLDTVRPPCVMMQPTFVMDQLAGQGEYYQESTVSSTLRAGGLGAIAYCYDARGNGNGETASTITGDHNNRITDYTSVLCMATGQANAEIYKDLCPTLNCTAERPIVFDKEVYNSGENSTGGHYISDGGPAPTLRGTGHAPGVCENYIVRRLTPIECARLQGFPDTWGYP